MIKLMIKLLVLAALLTACGMGPARSTFNPMGSMMSNPMSALPSEYTGMFNPIPASSDSLDRGAETF